MNDSNRTAGYSQQSPTTTPRPSDLIPLTPTPDDARRTFLVTDSPGTHDGSFRNECRGRALADAVARRVDEWARDNAGSFDDYDLDEVIREGELTVALIRYRGKTAEAIALGDEPV